IDALTQETEKIKKMSQEAMEKQVSSSQIEEAHAENLKKVSDPVSQAHVEDSAKAQSGVKSKPINLDGELDGPQFLSTDSILLSSKIEALEKALKGMRRADDMVDVTSYSLFPKARMPFSFRMPELEKFDGMGCPKTHLKMYVRAMQPRGADDELLAQMFQESLKGSASKWYLSLDEAKLKTWEDVCTE
ncbi:hypothetical protein HGI15_22460, partial [Modestobacter lapidis]|nr:hypothetical protein [Modestobacter lapidis]